MYLSEQAQITNSNFSLPMSYHFQGLLESEVLILSLEGLINQHKTLRSKVVEENGEVFFEIQEKVSLDLKLHKTSLESAVNDYKQNALLGFNLSVGQLFRFKIYEIDNRYTVLYINFHHLIFDGHSSRLFMRELEKRYKSLIKNENFVLPGIKGQKPVSSFTTDSVLELKKLYSSSTPSFDIPGKYIGSRAKSNSAGACELVIPAEHLEKAQKSCQELGITLYHFYTYAFTVLLKRYSNQNDFLIGTPVLGRNSKHELSEFGFFANTILLPMRLDEGHTLIEGLKDSARTINKVLKYNKVPYGKLIESMGRTSLYQSFFMFQDFSSQKQSFNDIPYLRNHLSSGMSHSKIDLWLTKYDGFIKGGFHYKDESFSKLTMERIKESFLLILNQLCCDSHSKLSDLPSISKLNQEGLIDRFSNFKDPKTTNFLTLFKKNVQESPDKFAIINDLQLTTYEKLDQESDLLASYLISRGVVPGIIVGICLPRSKNLLISFLAVLKLDCSFLPIDPTFPVDRIGYMATHSNLKFTINEKETNHLFEKTATIEFNSFLSEVNKIAPLDYKFKQLGSSTAYILYTSGSTGMPKGVEVSVLAMNNFLSSMLNGPGIKPSDCVIAITTISFDISILELFLPLMARASLYIASSEEARNGQVLSKLISKYKISFMQATPVTWRLLLESGWKSRKEFKALCGGENLPPELAAKLIHHCGEVWNMYGPTETTVWSTVKKLEIGKLDYISIGGPINNTGAYLLDNNRNMVPYGCVGEIYIGGAGVAKGYLNSPELTRERFFKDSFSENLNQRMYRTGDLGQFIGDEIICLGRVDQQVKLNGHRIELEEINHALNNFKGIKNSFSMVRECSNNQKKIVSYIILEGDHLFRPKEYFEFLKSLLPLYMIPNQYIVMEAFPLTTSGKVDSKGFPYQLDVSPKRGIEPKTMTEIKLALIWQTHIGREQVYLEDDFFQIGGNSLVAIGVFSSISQEFNLNMELSSLFFHKTLGELAMRIDTLLKSEGNPQIFSNLVKLQNGGEEKRGDFYFFHAIGGNTLNYRIFQKALPAHDIYGLQCTGVDGNNIKFRTVSEMATLYINEILKVSTDKPFNLAGGSFGGILVHEVARQLIERGYKIGTLVMFDTNSPNPNGQKSTGGLRVNLLSCINFCYQVLRISTPHSIRYKLIEYLNIKAAKIYKAKPIEASLLLLRVPLKKSGAYAKKDLGWDQYIKGSIEVKFIKATHDEFIESEMVVDEFKKSLE